MMPWDLYLYIVIRLLSSYTNATFKKAKIDNGGMISLPKYEFTIFHLTDRLLISS